MLLKGIHSSSPPEFLGLRRCYLDVPDTAQAPLNRLPRNPEIWSSFELAWLWGFFSCIFSCTTYLHAEVFGLLYVRLQMLKGQVQAQLTFLLVSLKLSRKQPSPRVAEVSGQAATSQKHVCSVCCCCSGRLEFCPQLWQTHTTRKETLSGSWRRVVWNSVLCGQCSSPTDRPWPAPFLVSPVSCAMCSGLATQTTPRPLWAFHTKLTGTKIKSLVLDIAAEPLLLFQ